MPFGDRTGPEGKGPMTGRRAGDCSGDNNGFARGRGFARGKNAGRGFSRGRGGWGWDRDFSALPVAISPEQQASALETQVQYLQDTLQRIKDQLENLKG